MNLPNHPLFEELKKIGLPDGDYAIFGSGPLWVRGIRESNDLDIIARGSAWEWAKGNGNFGMKEECHLECVHFADGNIEIYRDWAPGEWDIDRLIDTAEIIEGIPFVRLEHVIEWKKQKSREKDMRDLILIEGYLLKNKE